MATVIERIGSYATELSSEEIPAAARERVRDAFVDGIACAFLGLGSAPATKVRQVADTMGGREQVWVWGTGGRTASYWAALSNGVALRYWDFNDVYFGPAWTAHPSDNVAAVMAAAEIAGATGRELLDSLIVAYEVQMAFSDLPVEKNLWHAGWHHSTACAYASAAGASRLLRLDAAQAGHALALAGARTSTFSEIRHGPISMDKALSAPSCAANGLLAALLSRAGFTGCTTLLEGPYGFKAAVAGGTDVEPLVPTGREFRSTKMSLKPYPVEGMTITMVQAALEAGAQYHGNPAEIDEVVVTTYEEALTKPSWDELKVFPSSKETADHSFSYCVAVALIAGEVTLTQFDPRWFADPNVRELIPKIRLEADERYTELYQKGSRPAAVEVRGKAGTARAEVLYPKGDPQQPMSPHEIEAKFHAGADPILSDRTSEAFGRLMDIDGEGDVAGLAALLGGDGSTVVRTTN